MRKAVFAGLLAVLATASAMAFTTALREQPQNSGDRQAISNDNWLAAKENAEKYDRDGKYVEALQHYLEYTRQAEGLGRPGLVAWGKNNAAYMIIKMHKADPTVDLAPAKKLLEEGLAISAASEDCKRVLATNMEYVKLYLKQPE
ncbi:MAG: hypothetical protein A2Y70_05175 [Candidatus Aminicenantes bacterium RBG_13_64_14]|nr:MAG: hypothetical protein A2Y70_05175 [Candidatus Aminicenantes bacterium RBG_13_64_14]